MAKEPSKVAEDDADQGGKLTTATVIVKGPAKGRWRIGRHFTPEPTAIPLADLSAKEKEALATDPELMVTRVDPPH